jgi:hypothetical protein
MYAIGFPKSADRALLRDIFKTKLSYFKWVERARQERKQVNKRGEGEEKRKKKKDWE